MPRSRLLVLLLTLTTAVSSKAQSNGGGISLAGIGHDLGGAMSSVFIVEFADFGCSYCARFAVETYPKLDSAYIKRGAVRWKMVPFVTGMFRNSREVAEAAECAAEQGQFWKMHDLLYVKQKEWKASKDIRPLVARYAAQIKLDRMTFGRCVMNPQIAKRIQANDVIAQRLSIRGTPTFFVNGRVIPGAIPFDLFKQVIEAAKQGGGG